MHVCAWCVCMGRTHVILGVGQVTVLRQAGHIGNLGEIPDEGGRGQECVRTGLPSHDCILHVTQTQETGTDIVIASNRQNGAN